MAQGGRDAPPAARSAPGPRHRARQEVTCGACVNRGAPTDPRRHGCAGSLLYTRLPLNSRTASLPPPAANSGNAGPDGLVRVVEVDDCAFYAGDLFRRAFGTGPPDFPHHFVALYRAAAGTFSTVGYLHCSVVDELCLCGGLAEDARAVRRMPPDHQLALRNGGNIASLLVGAACARFGDLPALWAMARDAHLRAPFLAAGFAPVATEEHLVRWQRALAPADRDELVRRVTALGPF